MSWQKLSLQVPQHLVETFSDLLTEMGAVAVTLEALDTEELFEPPPGATPLWQHTRLQALFDATDDVNAVIVALEKQAPSHCIIDKNITLVDNQDWQKLCQDAFQPMCFGNKLWIQPSWKPAAPQADTAYVTLDPGLAFGTGSHPTTALCLEWLAQNIQAGDTVIDYGCGSGILAIAALKLGAKAVWAVDNDPQALEATLENAKRNHVTLHAVLPADLPTMQTDVLIANILANPLMELAAVFTELLKPQGKLVLSGILKEQAASVINSYPTLQFSPAVHREEWVRLEAHPETQAAPT